MRVQPTRLLARRIELGAGPLIVRLPDRPKAQAA
jgi:hypothetical protein